MDLSRYLKLNQLTDDEFAVQVGATPFAVGKWRRGERSPRKPFMQKIMAATNGTVTPNDFFASPMRSDDRPSA